MGKVSRIERSYGTKRYICNNAECPHYDLSHDNNCDTRHFPEKCKDFVELPDLKIARIRELEECLEFYANEEKENGKRARQCLGKEER